MSRTSISKSWEKVGEGGLVYLFLEDWELPRVALSCHFGIRRFVSRRSKGLVAV